MNIYQFDDYRFFLKELYKKEKSDPSFSCRRFASKAGFSNPGFINDVIRGKRKLSAQAVDRVIKVFSLPSHEADFFKLLVKFAHAKTTSARDAVYKMILYRRARSSFAKIHPQLTRYYQDHRYPLIRSAIMALDFSGDFEEMARFLEPSVPARIVKQYVRDLCEWGLVKVDGDGHYRVTEKFVEPAPTLNAQVKEINRKWLQLAEEAVLSLSVDERHISSMLFSISERLRDVIYSKIDGFRNEIWELVRNDPDKPECIMLLNTQFIPKSKKRSGKQ